MPAATYATEPRDVPDHTENDDPDPDSPRLWRLLVESRTWPTVLEVGDGPMTGLAMLLAGPAQSFCARVDGAAVGVELLRAAEQALDWPAPWAVALDLADLAPLRLADLATRLPAFLLDPRTSRPVRLPGGNGQLVGSFLSASWLDTEACVVANTVGVHEVLAAR